MHVSPLKIKTRDDWVNVVMQDFDSFLLDHAAAEKKASGMAMSLVSHYPDRTELVATMTDLAVEELAHFREVVKWIHSRGLITGSDTKDLYVNEFMRSIRKGADTLLLDRLLTASIIEARGAERFGLIAAALEDKQLKKFYQSIAHSEERHYEVFLNLASIYVDQAQIDPRWEELLEIEAQIVASLPIRAVLH